MRQSRRFGCDEKHETGQIVVKKLSTDKKICQIKN